jgi:hypothetical protein
MNQFGGGNHLVGNYFELTPEGPVMSIPYANNFFDTLSFNQTVDLAEGRIVFTADVTSVPWAEEGQTEELTGDLRLYFKNMSVKTVEKEGN